MNHEFDSLGGSYQGAKTGAKTGLDIAVWHDNFSVLKQ